MCVPKSDINSWENGKLLPTGQIIAKMDKVLGVKLPRPVKHWLKWRIAEKLRIMMKRKW
jgi:ribosome-binding protein aMBF1 (putative translation factor)